MLFPLFALSLFMLFSLCLLCPPSAGASGKSTASPSPRQQSGISRAILSSQSRPRAYLRFAQVIHPNGKVFCFTQALVRGDLKEGMAAVANGLSAAARARQREEERQKLSWRWDYGDLVKDRNRRLENNGYAELRPLRLGTRDMIYEIYFPSESALEACLAELEERSCLLYEEGPDMATEWPLEGNGLAQVYRNDKVLIAYWGDRFKVTEALEAVHGPPIYIYGAIEHKEMDV